jgi:hypothetical protein
VGLGEVQRAFNVFLGANIDDCRDADTDGNNEVSLGEVQQAFNDFLGGCGGGPGDVGAVRASSTTSLSSIRGVIGFARLASAGGGGGAAYDSTAIIAAGQGAGLSSGCVSGACQLAGTIDCSCTSDDFSASLSIAWDGCVFNDDFGNVVTIDGFAFLDADDPNICFGAEPFGVDFSGEFDGFFRSTENENGDFEVLTADYTEDFTVFDNACIPIALDPLAFAARGDGTRDIDGTIRMVQGNAFGVTADQTTSALQLSIDVALSQDSVDCVADSQVDGDISVTDAVAGTDFAQTFQGLNVIETPAGGGLFLVDVDGTVSTDCLGGLDLFTTDPLQLFSADECPVGGRLEVTLLSDGSRAAIEFDSSGGVSFDVDADGTIEESSPSCSEVELDQCGFEQPAGVCTLCSGPTCSSGLICAPCTFCDQGFDMRCAPENDFVFCNGDVY